MNMETIIIDFTGVYREQNFHEDIPCRWLDFTHLDGTNCYCTPESEQAILDETASCPVKSIRFLDSGNYHYVSKILMEKVKEPFDLLVFDNHTDMQESAFFGLLSCGSWVKEALKQNTWLRKVCIVGPLAKDCQKETETDRVTFVTREETLNGDMSVYREFLRESTLPLYISVDKDVLDKKDAATNWDQGQLRLETLKQWILEAVEARGCTGVDICGENVADGGMFNWDELRCNESTNKELLLLFRDVMEEYHKTAQ